MSQRDRMEGLDLPTRPFNPTPHPPQKEKVNAWEEIQRGCWLMAGATAFLVFGLPVIIFLASIILGDLGYVLIALAELLDYVSTP